MILSGVRGDTKARFCLYEDEPGELEQRRCFVPRLQAVSFCVRSRAWRRRRPLIGDDDVRTGAVDDYFEFGLLFSGDVELVERLLKVVEEGVPLLTGNFESGMRFGHGLAGVFLWTAGGPTNHFRHEVFEAGRGDA